MNQGIRFLLLTAIAAGSTLAAIEFPGIPGSDPWEHRPNDPDYPDAWHLFSHIPINHRGTISDQERALGSGMSVDRAWQLHTGRSDTLIALIDSGVYWDVSDVRDRIFINTREVPLPEGCRIYDCNADERVSISDYDRDPRVGDRNSNGMIDVEDLILAFSNGRDEDGNGFTDDISGWDFHEHDNNPGDRAEFGHGTGEAKDSVGQANNLIGSAGGCPNCSVVFLRANDSFVVDANAFAAAVHYGVDLKASIIQEALGSLNQTPSTQEAVNYAWRHNTLVIGSAADENSYHHNYPATLDPVIYVNAIRFDSLRPEEANSFLAFNNCSNFGARVDVAASGISCSSEATGNLSGIAALAASYAKSLNKPLTAGELSSLIKTTSTDINLGSNANALHRYSTWQGWDRITGYGRVHAFNLLKAIEEDHIPPTARIVAPFWFELFTPGTATTIPVVIETGLPRSGKVQARLEVTRGVDTSASQWMQIQRSNVSESPLDGLFAEIPLESLNLLPANQLDGPEYQNAITFRLIVDNLKGQTSEARRTVYLFTSDKLRSGFPKKLTGSGESSGLFADLDGDGEEEYVTADGAGVLHAFSRRGDEMPGFPVKATPKSAYATKSIEQSMGPIDASVYAPIAAADLDGDGSFEVVTASMEGDVSVIDGRGKNLRGSPFKLPFPNMNLASKSQMIAQGVFAAPVLADLDGNGEREIIIAAADGYLYAFSRFGELHDGFPVAVSRNGLRARLMSSPAVYDLNGDGILDIVLGTNHIGREAGLLFAIDGRGNRASREVLSGFPVQIPLIRDSLLPTVGSGIPAAPVIADLDGDGTREILIHGFVGKPYTVSFTGQLKRSFSIDMPNGNPTRDTSMVTGFGQPGVARFGEGNQISPIVLGSSSRILVSMANGGRRIPYNHFVGAWNSKTGLLRAGFPKIIDDIPLITSPVTADIDGDGSDEVVVGSGGYFLRSYSSRGETPGFPQFTGGWILGTPSISDRNSVGRVTIGATTREGYVFLWDMEGSKSKRKHTWPTFKGNNARTSVEGDTP